MSKTLRTAALVVGAVALIATGVGAVGALAAGTSLAAGVAGASVAGISAATIGFAGTVLGLAAQVTAKKPRTSIGGDQTKFTANKDQGLPYPMGRTSVSGFIVHRQTHGTNNVYQTFFAVLSAAGPIHGIEAFKVDGVTTSFTSAGAAQGDYANWMWLRTQLGQTPESAALASPVGAVPGWGTSSKLSGYAAYAWTLKFDDKGKKYAAGIPEPSAVLFGVKAYDPRQDSTYPGGSGAHRVNDESTWSVTDNAYLHGLTWLIGRHQNGKRVMGVGAPLDGIDVAAYVEACNIALANNWKMGGCVYSTDAKWDALKAILQAGGGEPSRIGALISCTINAPRVSLDTITSADLVGEASVAGTQSRRERINAVVPRYRSEAHGWEMVAANVVKVDAYIAEDGGQRTKEIEFPLVQDAATAAQLAAYEIVNGREFEPITLHLKPRWVGYRPGDCMTLTIPELNLSGQAAIIMQRSIDPSSGVVTLTLRSETLSKHDFALGRTASPPPTPSLQVIDPSQLLIPGVSAVWEDVANPLGTKPEDNATNSADLTSAFGSSTVGAYIDRVVDIETLLAPSGEIDDRIAEISAALDADPTTVTNQRVTVLEATTRQGAPNLVINGDFGDYDSTTGVIRGWTKSGSGWGVVLADRGTFAQITGGNGATLRQNVPAYGGNGYSFGIEGDPDSSTGSQTYLEWRNNSGVSLGTTPSLYPDDWGRVSSPVYTAPPGTASAEIVLRQNATGSTSISRWSHVQVQLGEPTLWTDPATTRSNAGRITSEEITRAGQTGSLAARAGVLEAQFAGTTGSYLKSVIDANQTTASSQYATVASQVNTLTSSITALSAPNLIGNGRFANGFSGWTTGGSGTWSVVTAYDEPFAQFTGSSFGYAFTDISNVLPNKPYCIGYEADPDAGQGADMYVEFWSAGFGSQLASYSIGGSDDWARVNGGAYTTPSGTAVARVGIQTSGSGTGTRRWRRIQFQQSTTPTDYSDSASLSALQSQVTIQAGTLASLGGQVTTQGSTLSGLSGTVAGQVTALGSLTTKVSVRTLAYWASEATTGDTTAFITGRAEMTDGTVTSSVAIGAKEFWVYSEVSGAWIKTFGVVGGNVLIYGNLAVSGSVSVGNLQFGATGNASLYYKQPYTDNAQTDWSAGPVGLGLQSKDGSPMRGDSLVYATNVGTPGGITYIKIIRLSDGNPVWGGTDGIAIKLPSDGTCMPLPTMWFDSVAADHGDQYDFRVRQTGGAIMRSYVRGMYIEEKSRVRWDQAHLEGPAGTGPGAGPSGGGQINGDGSGAGGTGGTTGTGTITTGGLRWKQIEE